MFSFFVDRPLIVPDGYQPTAVGLQPNIGPTFFFPNQGPPYQGQPAPRQATPPVQQQPQGGFSSQVFPQPFVNQTNFPVFQAPRMFNQQVITHAFLPRFSLRFSSF